MFPSLGTKLATPIAARVLTPVLAGWARMMCHATAEAGQRVQLCNVEARQGGISVFDAGRRLFQLDICDRVNMRATTYLSVVLYLADGVGGDTGPVSAVTEMSEKKSGRIRRRLHHDRDDMPTLGSQGQ